MNRAVDFFAKQFDRQIDARDYALNVFEERALQFLEGDVLDLGCGLGNLALAAAERGHHVLALDPCNRAVEDVRRRLERAGFRLPAQILVGHELPPRLAHDCRPIGSIRRQRGSRALCAC